MAQNNQMINEYNINNKVSADERAAESIAITVAIFRRLELDYAIFGSCGIQTYFDHFFRLPNDIDVIIRRNDISKLKAYCIENGHEFVEEVGRSKIYVYGFPVHIIPELFSIVNKENNSIIAQIDLSSFIFNSVAKHVNLLCASSVPKINVAPIEMCLFMDLIRTIQTNSLMTIYFVFRYLDIDDQKFNAVVQNYHDFAATIFRRLSEYPAKLDHLYYFSKEDILFARNRIANLKRSIQAIQGSVIR
jgi:hypothetical protein